MLDLHEKMFFHQLVATPKPSIQKFQMQKIRFVSIDGDRILDCIWKIENAIEQMKLE